MRKRSKLFLLPAFVIYTVLLILPILGAFYLSFTDWNGISPGYHIVGLKNYTAMLQDMRLRNAIGITLKITLTVSISVNVLGLFIASLVNQAGKWVNAIRSVFFLPYVISTVAISFIWLSILSYTGVLNRILEMAGMGSLAADYRRLFLRYPCISRWSIYSSRRK